MVVKDDFPLGGARGSRKDRHTIPPGDCARIHDPPVERDLGEKTHLPSPGPIDLCTNRRPDSRIET